jgi:hypothetical protein
MTQAEHGRLVLVDIIPEEWPERGRGIANQRMELFKKTKSIRRKFKLP